MIVDPRPYLLVVPTVRPEAGPGGEILLHAAVDPGREVELHVEPLLGVPLLGGVLVEHHHDLGHVVELADQTDVLHGAAPLLVLALDQPPVGEDGEEGVDVGLGGEVEPGPHVTPGRAHSAGVLGVQTVHCVVLVPPGLLPTHAPHSPGVLDVPQEVGLDLPQQRRADALGDGQLLVDRHPVLLGYDHIGQVLGIDVQLHRDLPGLGALQDIPVVLDVILGAVVDIRDLADVELVLRTEVFLQLPPAPGHQVPGLAVVEHLLVLVVLLQVGDHPVQLLDQPVDLPAALYGVSDVAQGVPDGDLVQRVQHLQVLLAEVLVSLEHFS